jgi:hypothetical protein
MFSDRETAEIGARYADSNRRAEMLLRETEKAVSP